MTATDHPGHFSLPLTVGVTGHRQLPAPSVGSLEKAVHTILADVRARAPSTPLLVLSSLAEGADRLVARVAMAEFGAKLVAVLPMPVDQYREDFASEESRAEFDGLLAASSLTVTPRGSSAPATEDPDDRRRSAYARAGEWIALHSHLLVALWDGENAHGQGGTAEIVEAKLKGRYESLSTGELLGYDEGGAIAHISTPRPGTERAGEAGEIKWLHAKVVSIGAHGPLHRFHSVIAAMERLNKLLARDGRTVESWAPTVGSHVEALKAAADFFARRFQHRIHLSVRFLAFATVLAAVGSELGWVVGEIPAKVIAVGAIASGCLLWAYAHHQKWQRGHTDFRALAEGCRVQSVWTASGVHQSAADHYHPVQATSVPWIRRAVRTAHLLDDVGPPSMSPTVEEQEREAAAATKWLDEQSDFFLGKHGVIGRYRRQARQFAILSVTCLVIGLIVLSGGEVVGTTRIGRVVVTGDLLLRAAKIVLAVGASLQAYHIFMAYGDLQRSYTVLAHLFQVAMEEAKPATAARNFRRLRGLIYELGRAALVENVSWVLTRRQRHFHPPLG